MKPSILNYRKDIRTAAQLQHLKQQLAAIKANAGQMKNYTVMEFDGTFHETKVPRLENSESYHSFGYRNIFEVSIKDNNRMWREPKVRSAAYLNTSTIHPDDSLSKLEQLRSHVPRWNEEWNNSQAKEPTTKCLEEHGKSMRQIRKVIGIGLGKLGAVDLDLPLDGDNASYKHESAYFQHLTLLHIANVLGEVQDNVPTKLFVQDPLYNNVSKLLLEEMSPDLEILSDPDAFLEMDSHTFLFHCHLPFDAVEIALAAAGEDGLAGMMCAPISDEDHQVALTGAKLVPGTKLPGSCQSRLYKEVGVDEEVQIAKDCAEG